MPAPAVDAEKKALRQIAAKRRAEAAATVGATAAGEAFCTHLLNAVPLDELFPVPGTVSGFWPLGDEIDMRPVLGRLHELGWSCCLPVSGKRNTPLIFRRWAPGEPLVEGKYGVMTPVPGQPVVEPNLLLVPLLAFDRRGYRLGYGGGFYDRTLERLRGIMPVLAIGAAFAAQEVQAVPTHGGDMPLDWLVTEREAVRIPPCRMATKQHREDPVVG
jgi:5-formyltetrahydrofolate cyclo-ligase